MTAALALCTGPAAAEVYKWVDESGIAHYTTDIEEVPEYLRDRISGPTPEPGDELRHIPAPRGSAGSLRDIPPPRGGGEAGLAAIPAPRRTPASLEDIPGPRRRPAPLDLIPGPAQVPPDAATPAPAVGALATPGAGSPPPEPPQVPPLPPDAPDAASADVLALPEPASPPPDDEPPSVEAAPPLDLGSIFAEPAPPESEEIRELEGRIERDREQLKRMLARQRDGEAFSSDAELRAIAERLPRLQSELESLRAQRPR